MKYQMIRQNNIYSCYVLIFTCVVCVAVTGFASLNLRPARCLFVDALKFL